MSLTVLYTIVPIEVIYAGDETDEGHSSQAEQLVEVAGRPLLVQAGAYGGAVISRLLSTDPRDFLDPRWQPGTRIKI